MADPTVRIRSGFCPSLLLAIFVWDNCVWFAAYDKHRKEMIWL